MELVNAINGSVSNYNLAISKVASEPFSNQDDLDKNKLNMFQNLLSASLTLKAIDLLTTPKKNPDSSSRRSRALTLDDLCKLTDNAKESICQIEERTLISNDLNNLNGTIASFNKHLDHLNKTGENENTITEYAQEMISKIPKGIDPDTTLTVLLSKNFIDAGAKNSIKDCLKDGKCIDLMEKIRIL